MSNLITGLSLTFFPLRDKIKGEGMKELKKLRVDLEKMARDRGFEISEDMIFLTPQLHGYMTFVKTRTRKR